MDPLPSTTSFFEYVQKKIKDTFMDNTDPHTFTENETKTLNHESLWRGCMVLPTHNRSHTREIHGNLDKIKPYPKQTHN